MNTTTPILDIDTGTVITVTTRDGYQRTGAMLGFTMTPQGPVLRLMAADGLEYRIPTIGTSVIMGA